MNTFSNPRHSALQCACALAMVIYHRMLCAFDEEKLSNFPFAVAMLHCVMHSLTESGGGRCTTCTQKLQVFIAYRYVCLDASLDIFFSSKIFAASASPSLCVLRWMCQQTRCGLCSHCRPIDSHNKIVF